MNFLLKFLIKSQIRAFTLIELLVSMAIFISVITIATGALFAAQAVNTKLEQTQLILDGVNLATEVMARDIRYGTIFWCDTGIPGVMPTQTRDCIHESSVGGSVISFRPSVKLPGSTNYSSDRTMYYLSNGAIYKNEYKEGNIANEKIYQITPNDVSVERLLFYVTGSSNYESGDLDQPLITIIISGVTVPSKKNVKPVEFNIQTSVSSRGLDI